MAGYALFRVAILMNRARAPDKNEPGRVQILHYNIERFPNEITDLRGLETLLLISYVYTLSWPEE